MFREDVRQELADIAEDAVVFDNPYFDNSIIGLSEDGRVVYSYESMCEEMANDDNISIEDAAEFIDYNTLRTIPYIGYNAPIVVYSLNI